MPKRQKGLSFQSPATTTTTQQEMQADDKYTKYRNWFRTPILHIEEQFLVGNCKCKYHRYGRDSCRTCVENCTIFEDDKIYFRLVKMFEMHQVPIELIREQYIVCGKNFESTKQMVIIECDLDETKIIDEIQEYDEVEIVENIVIPEKPDITIPVYDELPAPIILGKRQREVYVPAPEALLEEEEEITFYDGITGELIQENPPAKKQRILSQYEELIKSQIVECSIVGAMAHTYYKSKHNYFKQCKFIF